MKKILIIGPSWIGDTVISHTLYQLLFIKYHFKLQIDIISPEWCKSVINKMSEITNILLTPYEHGTIKFLQCYKMGQFLKKKYDQAIILPNSIKSALIPFLANIPIRTGWKGEMRYGLLNDIRTLNKKSFPLMIHRYAALAYNANAMFHFSKLPYPLPLPTLNIKQKELQQILHKFNFLSIYKKRKIIGLCPGSAYGISKNWPHYHYINLAIKLIHSQYHIIIIGSQQDKLLINKIIENSLLKKFKKYYHNLLGNTSLYEAITILSICSGIVSNDSGLMHIACALKKPVVALYGPSSPDCTPPLFYKSKAIFNKTINIYSKDRYKTSIYDNDGYHKNLINIKPEQVFQELQILLN